MSRYADYMPEPRADDDERGALRRQDEHNRRRLRNETARGWTPYSPAAAAAPILDDEDLDAAEPSDDIEEDERYR